MMRIAVCDDIPVHTDHVLMLLNKYQEERPGLKLNPKSFVSGSKLLEEINAGEQYDLYLLDIIMPETNGIALAQQIRLRDTNASVVFLTQSKNHALDAYGVSAIQYILKPISRDALFPILDKIIASCKKEEDKFISVSAPNRTVPVIYSSIVVVEHMGRVIRFHLDTGELIESKTIRKSFGVAIAEILEDRRFLWVHQSYIINMSQVRELRSRLFVMKNGMEISIPRPKYVGMKKAYLKYLQAEF